MCNQTLHRQDWLRTLEDHRPEAEEVGEKKQAKEEVS